MQWAFWRHQLLTGRYIRDLLILNGCFVIKRCDATTCDQTKTTISAPFCAGKHHVTTAVKLHFEVDIGNRLSRVYSSPCTGVELVS